MTKPIYLDYAASTPLDPEVLRAMQPYFSDIYANPGSLHDAGERAKQAVERSRETVARILHVNPEEIIFTSGGTESNNLAIKGIAFKAGKGHLITSCIEHHSVLDVCKYLETKGLAVTYLPVDREGFVTPENVEKAIRKDTILITIMHSNNEIGTIQPVERIHALARKYKMPFHADACQSAGQVELPSKYADAMTLNGSKIYGPKGIGILYKKSAILLEPLFHGGGQEFGVRSGTENVPSIVGFAKALEIAERRRIAEAKRVAILRDYFIKKLLEIPGSGLNGHPTQRLPNNVNISFKDIDAETMLKHLHAAGIYASSGSACTAHQIEVSHVLRAIRLPAEYVRGTIRFSLGRDSTKEKLDIVVAKVSEIICSLRTVA
ncbi:cysteine desulfurase [Candidatus Woesearchaeota archaeon]|nr:cysteine desulfurase [Candidatus Woesearchaeota archaeon]